MDVTGTINTNDPAATNREVRRIYVDLFGEGHIGRVETALDDIVRLYNGRYPGYQACDTDYHDLEHTLQAYLAAARMFDGLVRSDKHRQSVELVTLGLIATLGHDTGFIKTVGDDTGHGGKYTLTHVERSKDFMASYLLRLGCPASQINSVRNMIDCTGLYPDLARIKFTSPEEREAGYVVGSADYLGQMSDPLYINKLPELFDEYQEGHVPGYGSAADLIERTPAFFEDFVMKRLSEDFGNAYLFAAVHFGGRDVYVDGIKKNVARLMDIQRQRRTG